MGVYSACICCYTACNVKDLLIGCQGTEEFLCIEYKCCLAAGLDQYDIGMIKDAAYICKVGLPCCTFGLKMPEVLCLGAGKCLCLKQAAAFPFKEPVPGPICAVCCLQCVPNMG